MSQHMGSSVRQEPAWPGWRMSMGQSWGEDGGDNQEEVSVSRLQSSALWGLRLRQYK